MEHQNGHSHMQARAWLKISKDPTGCTVTCTRLCHTVAQILAFILISEFTTATYVALWTDLVIASLKAHFTILSRFLVLSCTCTYILSEKSISAYFGPYFTDLQWSYEWKCSKFHNLEPKHLL